MNDPYAVLGVNPSASDDEVKRAYRDLVKKYHPDNYVDNPLADLAEAKMKEVNEAYDTIVKQRTQGGYRASSSGGPRGYGGYQGGYSRDQTFARVRMLIDQNDLAAAEQLLRSKRNDTAEWYYLMGSIAYRKGWMDDARQNFYTACSMDPGNMEYRQAADSLQMQAGSLHAISVLHRTRSQSRAQSYKKKMVYPNSCCRCTKIEHFCIEYMVFLLITKQNNNSSFVSDTMGVNGGHGLSFCIRSFVLLFGPTLKHGVPNLPTQRS